MRSLSNRIARLERERLARPRITVEPSRAEKIERLTAILTDRLPAPPTRETSAQCRAEAEMAIGRESG